MSKDLQELLARLNQAQDKLEALLTEQAAPSKYAHINFKPPVSVARAATRGLELRKKHGRGSTSVGLARAVQLKNRETISPETAKRMYKFFLRHNKNIDNTLPNGEPSNGKIAGLLWGGYPGKAWSSKLWRQMEAADNKAKAEEDNTSVNDQDKKFARELMKWIQAGDKLAEKNFKAGLNEDLQEITEQYMYLSDEVADSLKEWFKKYNIEFESATKVGYLYKVGDKVSWKHGDGTGRGTIEKIYTSTITVKIKDTEVTRNGTEEVPAYLIGTDAGDRVLKLATEIDRTARDS